MLRIRLMLCAVLLLLGVLTHAQTNISGVINSYWEVTGIDKCNNNVTLPVTPIGLAAGDHVILIQMRGVDAEADNSPAYGSIINLSKSGNYEMFTVQSVVFNVVTFNEVVGRLYQLAGRVQLVRVPEYSDAKVVGEVTGQPWNGITGGVIAMIVNGTLTLNENIDAKTIGFRGADVTINTPCLVGGPDGFNGYVTTLAEDKAGKKGEGISENGDNFYARGAPANGGGGGNDRQTGGGGGSNFAPGGDGGQLINAPAGLCGGIYPGFGGWPLVYSNAENRIWMGGGGGGGSSNLGSSPVAGRGGGIILIKANTIEGNGFAIRSNGETIFSIANDDGAPGGGGGGTVLLDVGTIASALTVEVMGGDGGNVDNSLDGVNCAGPGGGGSGGLLWMSSGALPAGITLIADGGSSGVTVGEVAASPCFNSTNFAQDGADGGFLNNLVIPAPTELYIELTVDMIPDDAVVCAGNELFMSVVATGTGTLNYQWNDPATTNTPDLIIVPPYDFTYAVTVTDDLGCQLIGFVEVDVIDSVAITAYPDTTLVMGNFMTLYTNLDDPYTILWSPDYNISDITDPNPLINPYETTTYCVSATHPTGCVSTDCVTIIVAAEVALPNAFTPNGDGVNDIFRVPPTANLCEEVQYFKVFTRWGEPIYDYFKDLDKGGWDGNDYYGRSQEIGTYIYVVKMLCDGISETYSGTVHLLR
ncbi:MAG: gliding motility-associated C-terminal domain-containing protein [Chitinophagales bacterium]